MNNGFKSTPKAPPRGGQDQKIEVTINPHKVEKVKTWIFWLRVAFLQVKTTKLSIKAS